MRLAVCLPRTAREACRSGRVSLLTRPLHEAPAPAMPDPYILVAEDHPACRELLTYCFSSTYRVGAAADGAEAWETVQQDVPDLIVSDIDMPEMDGITLCKRVTETPTWTIPFLMLTGRTDPAARTRSVQAGADAYLVKPFDRTHLLTVVQALLSEDDAPSGLRLGPSTK